MKKYVNFSISIILTAVDFLFLGAIRALYFLEVDRRFSDLQNDTKTFFV